MEDIKLILRQMSDDCFQEKKKTKQNTLFLSLLSI